MSCNFPLRVVNFASEMLVNYHRNIQFGLLYLNNGLFEKEELLTPNWVRQSATPIKAPNFDHYGYQFWLNLGNDRNIKNKFYPHATDDMYFADGFQGQNLFIMPSKKLLILRMGMTASGDYQADHSIGLVLESIH